MHDNLRVLMVGDVVGQLGCAMFQKHVPLLKKKFDIHAVIVNGENSHWQGRGITPNLVKFFKNNGANVITTGNHIWARREIYSYLSQNSDLLRPANFPSGCPGTGVTTFDVSNNTIAVVNLQGRIFMNQLVDDPFRAIETILTFLKTKTKLIFVDFHAETTAEKAGIAYFLDGKISALVGTHTHVQTSDNRILPNGTAFITDIGMCGSLNSMIGMKKDPILQNYLTQMPVKFEVETEQPGLLSAVIIEVDSLTGKSKSIERVRIIDDDVIITTAIMD